MIKHVKGWAILGMKSAIGAFGFVLIFGPLAAVLFKPMWVLMVFLWNLY